MPPPTHAYKGKNGLRPFVTVNETIRGLDYENNPLHNTEAARFRDGNKLMRPWDGNTILPRAMTTSGGQNYHPTGERDFTIAEYARMQGFPPNQEFQGSYIKRQIGNAVPPCVAKVLFESIKKDLDRADGIEDEHERMVIDD